jgi:sigma-E factor negative regulatory protein RseA
MKPLPYRPDDEHPSASNPRAWLSALADGDAQAADAACDAWRDDEDARRSWHCYQLIGDVMRSEDLAQRPARDAAFLAGVRARLAAEPVVLAPRRGAARRQPWLVPVAAAAGFAVVAGVLVAVNMTQLGGGSDPQQLAGRDTPGFKPVVVVQPQLAPQARDPRFVHDQVLDEYLRMHQGTRGGLPPGAGLRPMEVGLPVTGSR